MAKKKPPQLRQLYAYDYLSEYHGQPLSCVRLLFSESEMDYIEISRSEGGIEVRCGNGRLVVSPECGNGIRISTDVEREKLISVEAQRRYEVQVQNNKDDAFGTRGKR